MLGTTRIPGEELDSLRTHTVGRNDDGHVLLIVGTAYFKLCASLRADFRAVTEPISDLFSESVSKCLSESPFATRRRPCLPAASAACFASTPSESLSESDPSPSESRRGPQAGARRGPQGAGAAARGRHPPRRRRRRRRSGAKPSCVPADLEKSGWGRGRD